MGMVVCLLVWWSEEDAKEDEFGVAPDAEVAAEEVGDGEDHAKKERDDGSKESIFGFHTSHGAVDGTREDSPEVEEIGDDGFGVSTGDAGDERGAEPEDAGGEAAVDEVLGRAEADDEDGDSYRAEVQDGGCYVAEHQLVL